MQQRAGNLAIVAKDCVRLPCFQYFRRNKRLQNSNKRCLNSISPYLWLLAEPHTIVKQICFPNDNVLFLSLFSLSKNWMHNVVWGCVEILPCHPSTIKKSYVIQIVERSCVMQHEGRKKHVTKKELSFSTQKQMV